VALRLGRPSRQWFQAALDPLWDAGNRHAGQRGLEFPSYGPPGVQGQGLLYTISNRGAHHLRGNMLGTELLGASKMLRGHGCFSIGPVLEEAYQWCSSLEESCKIYYYTSTLQAVEAQIYRRDLGNLEYRKHTDDYQTW
jgi:ribulose-5-phosphate 4-epimerase/fuculose-1-phosphate aldolase